MASICVAGFVLSPETNSAETGAQNTLLRLSL